MLKSKKGGFERLSNAGFRIGRKSESKKISSRDSILGSCPVIDADFVEVGKDSPPNPGFSSEPNSESIDSELLEKLREYLKRGLRRKSPRYLKKFIEFWKAELLKANSITSGEKKPPIMKK